MTDPLVLSRLWFTDAADTLDARGFRFAGDSYQVTPLVGGAVEDGYASGRSRGYTTEDDTVAIEVTLERLTADDRAWLTGKRGRTLFFRDHLGLKVPVIFYATPFTIPTVAPDLGSLACQLLMKSVTWSEAV